MRQIARENGAYLMGDMAHISGLVAAGVVPSPFDYCDIVSTTTHKTLRGCRAGLIFFRKGVRSVDAKGKETTMYNLESLINQAVFPGLQGGPHNHAIAGVAVALRQAMTPEFKAYQMQVLVNCQALSTALIEYGYKIVTGGSDNHLILLDLRSKGTDAVRAEKVLEACDISCNKHACPGETTVMSPSGLRLGSPALTSRGLQEDDFRKVADFIHRGIGLTLEVERSLDPKATLKEFIQALAQDEKFQQRVTELRTERESTNSSHSSMQDLLASADHIKFDLEIAVEQQLGAQPLPFPGMDKSGSAVCEFFMRAACMKGGMCPFRHISGEKTVVCKHWLRGLCKKGDQCEFLHEYDMTKMPECYFYSKFGECSNKECPFLHIDPESKIKDCPWYDRGFCKHGPDCRHRHTRRVICVNYLVGFCPEGKSCKFMHPRFELPMGAPEQPPLPLQNQNQIKTGPIMGRSSFSAIHLSNASPGPRSHNNSSMPVTQQNHVIPIRGPRPLDQVTCYKCGEKGHYANKCNKGHLAFLIGQ
ncbi:cleavage and polyadenylation specificity factor subunit 4 isoform X3 [Phyllopteryx taeniolatus]|nr:cleavage and polyadenylation specificity factor subunit 4 isoform X3 [Phyllopteryx taeniolatus]